MYLCHCTRSHPRKRIVLTGGPGAGKTAVLELARQYFCKHVLVLPEAAGILFGGGFPRSTVAFERAAAQRAIFRVQRELELIGGHRDEVAVVLCDRGTVDGAAYWPGPVSMWESLGEEREGELARYHSVIHLQTPTANDYNHSNPLRIESAEEATRIDERILSAWEGHPRRQVIASTHDFLEKAKLAVARLRSELPACCAPPV
ncbi:MAG TPA: ATP-binding protein [Polyangiales bacterium]|nr:ATP-binding protein [Polyangiales bacterium]